MRKYFVILSAAVLAVSLSGCNLQSKGFGYNIFGRGTKAETKAAPLDTEAKEASRMKPSAKELKLMQAHLRERREGMPQLRAGMTVSDLGKIVPLTFPSSARREIKKAPAFTASVYGYKIEFSRGTIAKIEAPAGAKVN